MGDFDEIKIRLIYGKYIEIGKNGFFVSAMTGEGLQGAMNAIWDCAINEVAVRSKENVEDTVQIEPESENLIERCLLI